MADQTAGKISWPRRALAAIQNNLSIVVVLASMLAGRASFADHYQVPTGSMFPTVHVGDRVLVNKVAYGLRVPLTNFYVVRFAAPTRGDVVVLDSPVDDRVLLKRVVGVPGDMIEVRRGRLIINGAPARLESDADAVFEQLGDLRHQVSLDAGGGKDLAPTEIAPGTYLVMGDNRGLSYDGRYFGLVQRSAILGRASYIYWSEGRPAWRSL